jgi:hypothetical protein
MEQRKQLISQIVDLELSMFLSVPTSHLYRCQEDPENFSLHRRVQFAAWSIPTLKSYLIDLQKAYHDGCNLMTIKYARMESLLPCQNNSELIDIIIELVLAGQKEFIASYPNLMRRGRPLLSKNDSNDLTSFETYLRSELETYSENTLKLLHDDILILNKSGSSLSESIYNELASQWGFHSLDELEKLIKTTESSTKEGCGESMPQ